MIVVAKIGWGRYHSQEGPFFGGTIKTPIAERIDSFAKKVLSITAAAEGGHYDAINMYDSGLLSVGAMQFIDVAPQFGVTRMLGEVAEKCGLEPLLEALQPALNLSNANFLKVGNDWRFSTNAQPVTTVRQQRELFFGDAQGNTFGSFNEGKKNRAKTWAACMANVWYIPGAVEAQSEYCLRRLMSDFTWGSLRAELFNVNVVDDGYVGATRALLLAYAVNAPAIVVKRYEIAKNNSKSKFSPDWCLEVLRDVVVNGGIDVWKARWSAKMPLVERAFGVKLPTYAGLVARSWAVTAPTSPPLPSVPVVPVFMTPDLQPWVVLEDLSVVPTPESSPIPSEPSIPSTPPSLDVVVRPNGGIVEIIMGFIKIMMEVVLRALGRR